MLPCWMMLFSSCRYFVKISWGWTLLLLTPFLILYTWIRNGSFLTRRLLSLAVATAWWYIWTEAFFCIEDLTGLCFEKNSSDVIKKEFTSKASCRRAGFHWDGYDISGHSFILSYSALVIMEEMAPMAFLKTAGLPALPRTALNLLYVALNLIVIVWVWMFACTSVYFHDFFHKLLGTMFGLMGWWLTYRVWFLKSFSPGLPPLPHPKDQKEHAWSASILSTNNTLQLILFVSKFSWSLYFKLLSWSSQEGHFIRELLLGVGSCCSLNDSW